MSEKAIKSEVIRNQPYINIFDLLEWLLMVYNEMETKGIDTTALYAVIENLHENADGLKKQIKESMKNKLSNVQNAIEVNKNEREDA